MAGAGERDYLAQGIELGIRTDGRQRESFRPISLATGFLAQANGSARVLLGATDVVVGVKVEVGVPDADRPGCGRVQYSVSCSPVADPKYQGRASEELEGELEAALQRAADAGPCTAGCGLDLSALGIVSGKKCWVLYVDGVVLNDDGNLLDALALAAKAALADTLIPGIEVSGEGDEGEGGGELEVRDDEAVRLDLSHLPVMVTVSRVGRRCVVDLSAAEEGCASLSLAVAVNAQGRVCGVTSRGGGGLDLSVVLELLEVAQRAGPGLIAAVDAQLEREAAEAESDDEDEDGRA